MISVKRNGRYGIDAPYAPAMMIAGAVICIGLIVFAYLFQLWITAVILLGMAGVYLHTTRRGKFQVWRSLLAGAAIRGDERVLDLGCGRGAVLLMAAEYLPRGHAVGVDIWSIKDQSGNAMATTEQNALAEGVAGRVELHTADMRQLPFESGSFDLIVSSVAIHNINNALGRDQAIDEAWRVLRPGGRLLIADISKSRRYRQRLLALGATVVRRNLGWRMWWGGPWVPTMLVDARKPA
ncbi:class I SAM-dependent methyltransferase [Rhodanobacter glycinis]|uniref:Class I SAM-dependent methyltransferase n=1 Tax=Rhodanobacter glycinis TaxID=582702 RepID=A0A502BZM1_9GAMM|nr:class I SAM-dependent methyltransferase [Rhodanobacter glycinis]TPG04946.1 class I SAM-dependent methyltransferase [Rhodanobacter glycinis]